ncbi:MAG: hypothetical protein KGI29_10155 [Pseudomonadota bacterium]|nr:hypothetical protein [Pseudomonadota bacterium]MDE3038106.1 hypothetical protein [Pseudomonadota bacterium]
MLIDAFTWFDETEMLLFRLKVLSPLVDKFILVEADYIHSGTPKPYYSDNLLDARFDPYRDKLIIHKMKGSVEGLDFSVKPTEYDETAASWQIEHQQRESIGEACRDFSKDALVMISDVDEIPSREALEWGVQNNAGRAAPVSFGQFLFYYNLRFVRNIIVSNPVNPQIIFWKGTILTTVETMLSGGAQALRHQRNSLGFINHGGWHLSYFRDSDGIKNKIEAMAHQELNKDAFKDGARIAKCIETGQDLFDRETPVLPVSKAFFPPYFREHVNENWW